MKWIDTGNERYKFVWSGDKRDSVTNGATRRLKLLEQNFYTCDFCKKPNVAKFQGIPCDDCLHSKKYQEQIKKTKYTLRTKDYRDAVAFGYDTKTGEPLAIDKKGRKFKESETIYAKHENDQFGWKATGKKVRNYDQ